jgi:hypothetical protein
MKVFISYCGQEGKSLSERLRDKMHEARIDAWAYSDPDYTYGDLAWMEIYKEIETRDWMIVLTTECSSDNINQINECRRALKAGNKVFSFVKHGTKTINIDGMKSRTWGEYDKDNFNEQCQKLIADFKKQEAIVRQYTEFNTEADKPETLKLLVTIRQRVRGLSAEKISESRQMIINNYLNRTIIRDVVHVGFTFETSGLRGQYILLQEDADQFKRNDVDYRLVLSDLGNSIVTGERKYLRQFLVDNVTSKKAISSTDLSKEGFSLLEEEVNSLHSKGYSPTAILSPIQVFQPFMHFFRDKMKWEVGEKEQLVLGDKEPLTIYWSHKWLPSQEFIILDKSSVRWRVKPDEEDGALATAIGSPLYDDKVVFFAQTLFKVDLLKPEAVSIITLPSSIANQPLTS